MTNKVKVSNQTAISGLFWFAGWLFTIGYICTVEPSISELSGWQVFLFLTALIPTWPLFLGTFVGMS